MLLCSNLTWVDVRRELGSMFVLTLVWVKVNLTRVPVSLWVLRMFLP